MTEEQLQGWEKWLSESRLKIASISMSPEDIAIFVRHIRFLQILITDLKQENTGYGRGVEDGRSGR